MAEIVNLNKVRKKKAKADKKTKAEENKRRFGLNKSQKAKNRADRKSEDRKLDGLRIYRPENSDDKEK